MVTDSGGAQSQPDEVVISTFNTAPVADAGEDQSIVLINTLVLLDGTQSYDDDGDEITYSWSLKSKPEGSFAELNDTILPEPTFTADLFGDYVVELIVSDPWTSSAADEVLVSFDNVPPVAVAGGGQSVLVGETVYLDGRESSDVNGDPLSYLWSMVTKPDGSSSVLNDLTSDQTSFVADTQGLYVISLVVNDGLVDSLPDNVSILATSGQEELEVLLRDDAVDMINSLDPEVFKNTNMQKTLVNKINAVLNQINQGFYQEALDKLENDIIGKMDGCAETGSPDKNDMIQDCAAQQQVYPIIVAAIELLKDMI